MSEKDSSFELYSYICRKLATSGLEKEELKLIGDARIGQQSVEGFLRINKRLRYITEREGKYFAVSPVEIRLTTIESEKLQEKANKLGVNASEFARAVITESLG